MAISQLITELLQNYKESLELLELQGLKRFPRDFAANPDSSIILEKSGRRFISFCSNDYLGLSTHPNIKKASAVALDSYGLGASSSRYISGNHHLYQILEKQIAEYKSCDDSIIFSSGYCAAIGIIPALVGRGDLIIADKLIHASLIDGAKLSGAKFLRFPHNDIKLAKRLLLANRSSFKRCLIITETVFSMDGDLGLVDELLKIALKFDTLLLSDDAHGIGLVEYQNHPHHLQTGTLSKAFGALGGYVAGDKILIEYLRNFARSAIYSTALPPAIIAACLESLKLIKQKDLAIKAMQNAQYFCQLMERAGFRLAKPSSPIIVIILKEVNLVMRVVEELEKCGFLVSAIRPPTVEQGKSRIRITFCANHGASQIEELVISLSNVFCSLSLLLE